MQTPHLQSQYQYPLLYSTDRIDTYLFSVSSSSLTTPPPPSRPPATATQLLMEAEYLWGS